MDLASLLLYFINSQCFWIKLLVFPSFPSAKTKKACLKDKTSSPNLQNQIHIVSV